MKKTIIFILTVLLLAGCATRSFDTFEARTKAYDTSTITPAAAGLTADQIRTILNTKFPKKDLVSVALFFMVTDWRSDVKDLKENLINGLVEAKAVERVVPVPPFIIPQPVTFESIQQVGVRTLSEYSLLILGASHTASS